MILLYEGIDIHKDNPDTLKDICWCVCTLVNLNEKVRSEYQDSIVDKLIGFLPANKNNQATLMAICSCLWSLFDSSYIFPLHFFFL